MPLIRISKKFGRNILIAGCSECFHSLTQWHSEIFFILNDEYGSIPVFYIIIWRELCVRFWFWSLPVWSSQIIIRKPQLFGSTIHTLEIKYSTMGYKCFKAFLMMPCKPVNTVATKAGAHCSKLIFVNKRKVAH